MAAPDGTQKAAIYHILYQINAAFCAIVGHYQELRETGMLSAKFTRRYEGFTRELQAEFNQDFLLPLHGIELDDWARFGKVRQQWEKHLRGADDDSIHPRRRVNKKTAGGRKRTKAQKSHSKPHAPREQIESKRR
jgi:hypothetical protein